MTEPPVKSSRLPIPEGILRQLPVVKTGVLVASLTGNAISAFHAVRDRRYADAANDMAQLGLKAVSATTSLTPLGLAAGFALDKAVGQLDRMKSTNQTPPAPHKAPLVAPSGNGISPKNQVRPGKSP